ncbi:MAG: hypothetical protein V2A52_02205 [archaeon]
MNVQIIPEKIKSKERNATEDAKSPIVVRSDVWMVIVVFCT